MVTNIKLALHLDGKLSKILRLLLYCDGSESGLGDVMENGPRGREVGPEVLCTIML